jgi:MFS family permease
VLATVLFGMVLAILSASVVNVAVPALREGLAATYGQVQFVVAAYVLGYGVFLITGGRLGDIFGRRRLFLIGIVLFTLASALCGMAPDAGWLVAARGLQGLAGALLFPQVLAIIQTTFAGHELDRALGVFGAVIGAGAVAGQLVGGLLLAANPFGLSWRSVILCRMGAVPPAARYPAGADKG